MKKYWWKEAVCYQIYPRSFLDTNGDGIGDLPGILAKLDYLKELGIDVIWICPIYKSPNADNGYDISDYQQIAAEFGDMQAFDQLLQAAHQRGMKIIMDLVVNHTSDEHPWFIESRSSKDSAKRDWYIWRQGKSGAEPNNWESIFSGSAWELDPQSGEYYLHLFDKKQPDLNWKNPTMRTAVYQMINWWLDKGIDGFRLDAITHIVKRAGLPSMPNPKNLRYVPAYPMHLNQPGILERLTELKQQTYGRREVMTVGEANGLSAKGAIPWVREPDGIFNMIFQFEHVCLWEKTSKLNLDIVAFKKILSSWQTALHDVGWNALYLENHDRPRSVSVLGNDSTHWQESAKMLAALYFLMQGTPFIYQGQEIGMTNVHFPSIDNYNDVDMKNYYRLEVAKGTDPQKILDIIWQSGRDNSRTPMQWDGSHNGGFSSGKPWMKINPNYTTINVQQQLDDPNSVYAFYRQLIRLRKQYSQFIYGDYHLLLPRHPQVFAYSRKLDQQQALVLCNMKGGKASIRLRDVAGKDLKLALANYPDAPQDFTAQKTIRPYEVQIYVTA